MSIRQSIELLRKWSHAAPEERPTPEQLVRWAAHKGDEGRPDQDPIVQDYLLALLQRANRGDAWLRRYALNVDTSMAIYPHLVEIHGAFWPLAQWRRRCRLPMAGGDEGVSYRGLLWLPTRTMTFARKHHADTLPDIVREWDERSMGQAAIDMVCSSDPELRARGRLMLHETCQTCWGVAYVEGGHICGDCNGEGRTLQFWEDG